MVTLTIDGQEVTVPAGTLVIRAAEEIGAYIPRFCDHPLLDPLGACRQCLVEVEGQRKPLTACTTFVSEGMVVKTQATSEVAKDGQEGVLELLLINHPLDCPMCDKGGECPLQDQALAYGPGGSRYVDDKRRFTKPIPISPQIKLDRERCVLCARCTRFADQISGDPFIELYERGALEQVAVSEDEPYESIFSGNVVQICPVGALTATQYRFKARPFDVQTTPSACDRCAAGCATDVQSRRGELVRVLARDDRDVNDEWLCDKGRFAYSYTTSEERITEPLVRKDGDFVAVTWAEALRIATDKIAETRDAGGRFGVLAGSNLVDEDAYTLSRFARTVLGTNDVDTRRRAGTADEEALFAAVSHSQTATNADIDAAEVILVAGTDLQQESPIVFLRVRKAARRGALVVEVGPRRTALSRAGATWLPSPPGGETGVLVALSRALDEGGESGLDPWSRAAVHDAAQIAAAAEVDRPAAERVVAAIKEANGAVVMLAGDDLATVPGAVALGWNLMIAVGGAYGWVPRKAGARGAVEAGLVPGLLPYGRPVTDTAARAAVEDVWGRELPAARGRDGAAMLADAPDVLLLIGADPVADFADRRTAETGLDRAGFVIAHDMFMTESAKRADLILPVSTTYERDGTITNWEGRRRAVTGAVPPPGLAQTDTEILTHLAHACGATDFPRTQEAIRAEMERLAVAPDAARALTVPDLTPLERGEGMVLVPRALLLDTGTRMAGADELMATAEAAVITLHPEDASARGLAAGDVARISTARGSLQAPVALDAGVARGAVIAPMRSEAGDLNVLMDATQPLTLVAVEGAR